MKNTLSVKTRYIGHTKLKTIKMYLRDWWTSLKLKYYPPSRYGFATDRIEDGVEELLIPKSHTEMKKTDDGWEQDKKDDGYESFWVVRR